MSVNLHISVTVSVQGCKHDAKGTCPVTEQHKQTVTKALLREDTSSLVHCALKNKQTNKRENIYFHFFLF